MLIFHSVTCFVFSSTSRFSYTAEVLYQELFRQLYKSRHKQSLIYRQLMDKHWLKINGGVRTLHPPFPCLSVPITARYTQNLNLLAARDTWGFLFLNSTWSLVNAENIPTPLLGLRRKYPPCSWPQKAASVTCFQDLRSGRRFWCLLHLVQGWENVVGRETCVRPWPDLGEWERVLVNVSELVPAVNVAQVSPGLLSFQKKPQIY